MLVDGLILAGGKSRRMGGYHKGDLVYRRQTFLEHMIGEFRKEAGHIWISYGAEQRKGYEGCGIVTDEFLDCGPMGGLHAGLHVCVNEYVMTAACDMPFLEIGLYRYLYGKLKEAEAIEETEKAEKTEKTDEGIYMGAVPVAEGKVHPLAAIYRKGMEKELERRLKAGEYRLRDALDSQKILYVDVTAIGEFRKMLMNVNTVSEYETLTGDGCRGDQRIVAVCGTKNSGKTTLLVRLVKELTKRGIKTAVIKHDGHDFSCDIPGTDSYRFQEAGAYATAVYSRYRMFIHKLCEPEPEELIRQLPEADIIFIEGMKGSAYPKLEVIRKEISEGPVSNPEGRFLLVTDWGKGHFDEPSVGFDELEIMIEKIMEKTMKKP